MIVPIYNRNYTRLASITFADDVSLPTNITFDGREFLHNTSGLDTPYYMEIMKGEPMDDGFSRYYVMGGNTVAVSCDDLTEAKGYAEALHKDYPHLDVFICIKLGDDLTWSADPSASRAAIKRYPLTSRTA